MAEMEDVIARKVDAILIVHTDLSLLKSVKISERHAVQLRMDAYNALNHATFWSGDQNINSTTFGVISSMFYSPRIMQFGLIYKF